MMLRIAGEGFGILCHGALSADSWLRLGGRINRAVRDLLIDKRK